MGAAKVVSCFVAMVTLLAVIANVGGPTKFLGRRLFTPDPCVLSPRNLSYPTTPLQADAEVDLRPSFKDGIPETFSVMPDLPNGLDLDPDTGEISGELDKDYDDGKTYKVTAANAGGESSFLLTLSLALGSLRPGSFHYPKQGAHQPGAMVDAPPSKPETGGEISEFSNDPDRPEGLIIDEVNGEIKGTISKDQKPIGQKYTVTAENNEYMGFSFQPGAMVDALPSKPDTGGEISEFSIDPDLPEGLIIDKVNGEIKGTISKDQKPIRQTYTVTAENDEGEQKTHILIVVSEVAFQINRMAVVYTGTGVLFVIFCIACSFFRKTKYGYYMKLRNPTDEEEQEEQKVKAEKMARRVEELLGAENPNYEDPELVEYVNILKSKKEYVKALCGAPWKEWSAPGECQVCKKKVDRKEKGLHCGNGGHRICWGCMCKNINWVEVVKKENATP